MAGFHILTVGWDHKIIDDICNRIESKSDLRFSHVVHPIYTPLEWPDRPPRSNCYFLRDDLRCPMPIPAPGLLASLEADGVPTIHNMIMSDRIVSKLKYDDALGYATFLAQRFFELFGRIGPSVIVGSFDAIHGSLGLAVARRMNIPWFAPHFSDVPPGLACFCEGMSPATRVITTKRPPSELRAFAEASLEQFENKKIRASAHVPPPPLNFGGTIARLPKRMLALHRTIRKSRIQEYVKFTEEKNNYSVQAVFKHFYRTARARNAAASIQALKVPPDAPYVLFGLHMQPESSIDVWAPFFSNQMWVVEMLSRAVPPSHKLLVKIHKSDVANHSQEEFEQMGAFPGVELVAPFADTYRFLQKAALVVSIQGTMGLEAALLGKPVIMLGDSPFTVFPSVSRVGEITNLPDLIRTKLGESPPNRGDLVGAYANYLSPFLPASENDWGRQRREDEIEGYVELFRSLKRYEARNSTTAHEANL